MTKDPSGNSHNCRSLNSKTLLGPWRDEEHPQSVGVRLFFGPALTSTAGPPGLLLAHGFLWPLPSLVN